jgi:hypothetical protein
MRPPDQGVSDFSWRELNVVRDEDQKETGYDGLVVH